MKFKKILLTVAAPTLTIVAAAATVSCFGGKKSKYKKIANSEELNAYLKTMISGIKPLSEISENWTASVQKEKPLLITDEGDTNDKSFNQSSWEALELLQKQYGVKVKTVKPTGGFAQAYSNALDDGSTLWVLSGFKHGDPITKWLKENNRWKQVKAQNIKIVAVDFDLGDQELKAQLPNFYSLQYNTREGGWMAGYASAKFLAQKYAKQPERRVVATFGGGAFPGVYDFNIGYLRGILDWNEQNPTLKVKHGNDLNLDSGFEPGDKMTSSVQDAINTAGVSIVLPVAGPATGVVLAELNKIPTKKDVYVIGVDVDQSNTYVSDKGRLATSITKGLGQSVYDIISDIALKGTEEYEPKFDKNERTSSFSYVGDAQNNWTGVADATLANEDDNSKMNEALSEARSKFTKLSAEDKEFIASYKLTKNSEPIKSGSELLGKLIEKSNN
ncbi:BMP family ABC transporter substrate-binding protein [Mycoplasma sp. Ms02]|uniref:BMP family ABC transporter substrate-binding protein n=1 Tax=Mycoplasma sp. Ms02 TaxID=353851 RepID=UPI001C899115|nr:BMP family ABC transporter substrate-binding protein [Mycoplasma sp. Ms02]QZE12284.1 BMP family ABC transporter substrate-binding protein [Mycoplasma sp. Ms02]